jgi:DNA topoisomerase-1
VDYLLSHFEDIIDIEFTAHMENKLDDIEDGGKEWQKVIAEFYPGFKAKLEAAGEDTTSYKAPPVDSGEVCEKCGSPMLIREGRYGKFMGCAGYPDCKNIKNMDSPVAKCPKCGKGVNKRKSKAGKIFYGCSGYPACDFISWDLPAPYLCPECASTMKVYQPQEGEKKYICTKCKHRELAPTE